jgi:hypothetical protein
VHPNNKLTINAIEAAPLESFSSEVCALRHASSEFEVPILILGRTCEPTRGPEGAERQRLGRGQGRGAHRSGCI